MKKLKILTIMAAAAVVSAGVYAAPVVTGGAIQGNEVVAYADSNVSVTATVNSTNSLNPTFKVTNNGSESMNLTGLKLYYYYSDDAAPSSQQFNCYYAGTTNGEYQGLTQYVSGKVESTTLNGSNTVLVVTFSGGSLAAGQSMEVQTNVNKQNWEAYSNLSNAYGVAYEFNGQTGTGEGETITDSTISTTYASYDKQNPSVVSTDMTLNGNTLVSLISSSKGQLVQGRDYTVSGTKVTFTDSYLKSLNAGTEKVTFKFSKGNDQTMTIVVKDTPITDAVIEIGSVKAAAGEEVRIPITISGLPTGGLKACTFRFSYDESLLEDVEIEPADSLNAKLFTGVADDGVAKILYSAVNSSDYIQNGVIGYLVGTAKGSGVSTLSAVETSKSMFLDKNSNNVKVDYKSGILEVEGITTELTVDLGSVEAEVGEEVRIPVKLSKVPEGGLKAFTFRVKYDEDAIEDVELEAAGSLNAKLFTGIADEGVAKALYSAVNSSDYAKDGVIFYITGIAKKSTKIEATETAKQMFLDANGNTAKVTYTTGSLTVKEVPPTEFAIDLGNVEANEGEEVRIPVTISKVPAGGLKAFTFRVKYDENVLEDVELEAADSLNAKLFTGVADEGVAKALYSAVNASDYVKDGVLFYIVGTAKQGTTLIEATETSKQMFLDANGNTSTPVYTTGKLVVKGEPTKTFEIDLGSVTGKAGEEVRIPVTLSNLPAGGVKACTFRVKYDDSVLEDVEIDAGSVNPKLLSGVADEGVAKILYSAVDSKDYIKDGVAFYLIATIAEDADGKSTTLEATETSKQMFLDAQGKTCEVEYNKGLVTVSGSQGGNQGSEDVDPIISTAQYLSIDKVEANVGDEVVVAVKLEGDVSATNNFEAACCVLDFDTSALEFVGAEAGSIVKKPAADFDFLKNADGTVYLQFMATKNSKKKYNLNTTGDLFNVTFKVKKAGKSAIKLVNGLDLSQDSKAVKGEYIPGRVVAK